MSGNQGHVWEKIGESEVTSRVQGGPMTKKVQCMWVCDQCGSETLIDGPDAPETKPELYGIEPLELDGTTIQNPVIPSCAEVIARNKP
ncbi:MAG: hypothetical protein ACREHV_15750 [Rhizomicrobium sp.]